MRAYNHFCFLFVITRTLYNNRFKKNKEDDFIMQWKELAISFDNRSTYSRMYLPTMANVNA